MRREPSEEFGRRVREVVGEMSLRAADRKTGVNYATLGEMTMGRIPEMESVVKFAHGFGLDPNEWLELAGYEPVRFDLAAFEKQMKRQFGNSPEVREIITTHIAQLREVIRAGEDEPQRFETAEEEIEAQILYERTRALETIRAAARELTWEPVLEGASASGYQGDQDIPREDVKVLETVHQAMAAEQRRKQGRD